MTGRPARSDALFGALLFVVALVPRLAVALALSGEPVWDGHYYDFGAKRIAAGLGYSDDLVIDGHTVWHPWCHYPVGYSGFLGLVYRVFGAGPHVANVGSFPCTTRVQPLTQARSLQLQLELFADLGLQRLDAFAFLIFGNGIRLLQLGDLQPLPRDFLLLERDLLVDVALARLLLVGSGRHTPILRLQLVESCLQIVERHLP